MISGKITYSYNDVMIMPKEVTSFLHRSEATIFDENGKLPIFTAPMSSVVNEFNKHIFDEHHIYTIMPRTVSFNSRKKYLKDGSWVAFSLHEFEELFITNHIESDNVMKALIDIANGHMSYMYELVQKAKEIYGDKLLVMIGNIANPQTYREVLKSKADFVRCSIGTGRGCLSSSNVGVGYGIATLIDEIAKIRNEIFTIEEIKEGKYPKIIADGGIRNYSDVIKALALGADYVMIGGVFASMFESCAETYINGNYYDIINQISLNEEEKRDIITHNNVNKIFFGMSTKKAQKMCNHDTLKTSEGIVCTLNCKYTIKQWVDNMIDYLRSAMSYTDCKTLYEFKNNVILNIISPTTQKSINE